MAGGIQSDDCQAGGLSPAFVFWWIAAFVFLIAILIIATICCSFPRDEPEEPCH